MNSKCQVLPSDPNLGVLFVTFSGVNRGLHLGDQFRSLGRSWLMIVFFPFFEAMDFGIHWLWICVHFNFWIQFLLYVNQWICYDSVLFFLKIQRMFWIQWIFRFHSLFWLYKLYCFWHSLFFSVDKKVGLGTCDFFSQGGVYTKPTSAYETKRGLPAELRQDLCALFGLSQFGGAGFFFQQVWGFGWWFLPINM